jgi:hypothetical protein
MVPANVESLYTFMLSYSLFPQMEEITAQSYCTECLRRGINVDPINSTLHYTTSSLQQLWSDKTAGSLVVLCYRVFGAIAKL